MVWYAITILVYYDLGCMVMLGATKVKTLVAS